MIPSLRSILRRTFTQLVFHEPIRDQSWQRDRFKQWGFNGLTGSVALDLGSGPSPRNPFHCADVLGVDIRGSEYAIKCDLSVEPIPLNDSSVSIVTSFDFLEHVPRVLATSQSNETRFPFIDLMNEVYRILKPGGLFYSSTPCFPWPMAYQDPTHVNIMTEDTLKAYFCEPLLWAKIYGFTGSFEYLEGGWVDCHHNAILRKSAGSQIG